MHSETLEQILAAQLKVLDAKINKPTPRDDQSMHLQRLKKAEKSLEAIKLTNRTLQTRCDRLRAQNSNTQHARNLNNSTHNWEEMFHKSVTMHAELMNLLRDEAMEAKKKSMQQELDEKKWRQDLEAAVEAEQDEVPSSVRYTATSTAGDVFRPTHAGRHGQQLSGFQPYEKPFAGVPQFRPPALNGHRPSPMNEYHPLKLGDMPRKSSSSALPVPKPSKLKAEEELMEALKGSLDNVSDTELEDPDPIYSSGIGDALGKKRSLSDQFNADASPFGAEEYVATGKLSFSIAAMAILFALKLRKFLMPPLSSDDLLQAIETMESLSAPYFRRALRPVVISILNDPSLALDFAGQPAPTTRMLGFLRRGPSTDISQLQASKLKVRTRALINMLQEELNEPHEALISPLRFICTRRVTWPNEVLIKSVLLLLPPAGTMIGASAPTGNACKHVALSIVLVRVVIQDFLLHPREGFMRKRVSAAGVANLRMVAAFLLCLLEVSVHQMADDDALIELPSKLRVDSEIAGEPAAELKPELDRLCKNGLPLLKEWLPTGRALLDSLATTLEKHIRGSGKMNAYASGAADDLEDVAMAQGDEP